MTGAGARPRALDLFCGAAGGWTRGLHRAGFDTVAACEIDPWRRARYTENFPSVLLYADIRDLTGARLAADGIAAPWIICGSPPCQDASAANTRGRGVDGERTGLYREWLRLVSELRPAWTAVENSPRLRTRGIDRLLAELESLDYAVWPLVVAAGDIGAPHQRERVWIIAADSCVDRKFQPEGDLGQERGRRGDGAVFDDRYPARLGRDGWGQTEAPGRTWPELARDDPRHGADAGCVNGHETDRQPVAWDGAPEQQAWAALGIGIDPDTDRTRPQVGQSVRNDIETQLPSALRVWVGGW